jgi:hypothetical protein
MRRAETEKDLGGHAAAAAHRNPDIRNDLETAGPVGC